MSKLIMKVSRTVIKEFSIDLDDWYSYDEMSPKHQHEQIQNCIDHAGALVDDGELINETYDFELLEWDLEK